VVEPQFGLKHPGGTVRCIARLDIFRLQNQSLSSRIKEETGMGSAERGVDLHASNLAFLGPLPVIIRVLPRVMDSLWIPDELFIVVWLI
jgi:hypothetical protein